jgi:hypothetical protein
MESFTVIYGEFIIHWGWHIFELEIIMVFLSNIGSTGTVFQP